MELGPFGENGVYTRANGTVINGTRSPLGNQFGSNGYFMTTGNSSYNSLQVTLRHRSGPLELLAGYTWSKSIDDSSGWGDQMNPLNFRLSRSLSSFDVPNNFVLSYHYDLPFERFWGRHRLTSGWTISGVTRFATGLPVTLIENDDNPLLGTFCTGPNCNVVDTPNVKPGSLQYNDPRSGKPYFDPTLFSLEALGQLGNAGKRYFHGPGLNNWDMALLKDTRITESKMVQFRLEFCNIFNHAQFYNPPGDILNGNFGYVTSARDPNRPTRPEVPVLTGSGTQVKARSVICDDLAFAGKAVGRRPIGADLRRLLAYDTRGTSGRVDQMDEIAILRPSDCKSQGRFNRL